MASLGEKITGTLSNILKAVLVEHGAEWDTWFDNAAAKHSSEIIRASFAGKPGGISPLEIGAAIKGLKSYEEDDTFWDRFEKVLAAAFIYSAERLAAIAGPVTLSQYASARKVKAGRYDVGTAMMLLRRSPELSGSVRNDLMDLGWSTERIDGLLKATENWLDVATQLRYWHRSDKSWAIDTHLKELGLPESWQRDIVKALSHPIPGAGDLVRMVVREAFDDKYASDFKTDQDRPPDFDKWMLRQGFTEEWSKYYWRSHWNVPSPTQGFEMLHRGIIGDGELDELLHALDIMPWWRPKLKAMAYNVLTRVDVRRIAKQLGKDKAWIKARYLEFGYDETNAQIMADFTEAYNEEGERDLTKAELLKLITDLDYPTTAIEPMLAELGYSIQESGWLIALATHKAEVKKKELQLGQLKQIYLKLDVMWTWFSDQLSALEYDQDAIDKIRMLWEAERRPKKLTPSKADLLKWVDANIISYRTLFDSLVEMGYDNLSAGRYVVQAGGDPRDYLGASRHFTYNGSVVPEHTATDEEIATFQ